MKALFLLIAAVLMVSTAFTQTSSPCISCNNNVIDTTNYSSAIGSENISTGLNSFAGGFQCEAIGDMSLGFGNNSSSSGLHSIALGSESLATHSFGIAIGKNAIATNINAVAIGKYVESSQVSSFSFGTFLTNTSGFSFLIGKGASNSQRLENTIENSLIIGFNSQLPTLFIGPSTGSSYTGKVGIGNVNNPDAKLHIKADINEEASLFLQPTGALRYAMLLFGDHDHTIKAKPGSNFTFSTTENDFVFENGNIGINTEDPVAKLQVNDGDIFIEDIDRGIVMKSPDGSCWRGTLDNSGMLNFVQVNCNDLLTGSLDHSDRMTKRVNIYPNPTGSKLFISIDQELTGSILEITNINGKILTAEVLAIQESCIDMSSYSKGIYIYTVKNNNGIIDTGKVVKE